jgi:hypothetical protein
MKSALKELRFSLQSYGVDTDDKYAVLQELYNKYNQVSYLVACLNANECERINLAKKISQLQDEMQRSVADRSTTKNKLERQLALCQGAETSLKQELVQCNSNVEVIKKTLEEEIVKCTSNIKSMQKTLGQFEYELRECRREKLDLANKRAVCDKEIDEMKRDKVELTDIRTNLEREKRELNEQLDQMNSDVAKGNETLRFRTRQLTELREQLNMDLASCKGDLNNLEVRLKTREDEKGLIQAKFDACSSARGKYQQDIVDITAALQQTEADKQRMDQDLQLCSKDKGALIGENASLQKDKDAVIAENTSLQTDLRMCSSDKDAVIAENASLRETIIRVNAEINDLKQQISIQGAPSHTAPPNEILTQQLADTVSENATLKQTVASVAASQVVADASFMARLFKEITGVDNDTINDEERFVNAMKRMIERTTADMDIEKIMKIIKRKKRLAVNDVEQIVLRDGVASNAEEQEILDNVVLVNDTEQRLIANVLDYIDCIRQLARTVFMFNGVAIEELQDDQFELLKESEFYVDLKENPKELQQITNSIARNTSNKGLWSGKEKDGMMAKGIASNVLQLKKLLDDKLHATKTLKDLQFSVEINGQITGFTYKYYVYDGPAYQKAHEMIHNIQKERWKNEALEKSQVIFTQALDTETLVDGKFNIIQYGLANMPTQLPEIEQNPDPTIIRFMFIGTQVEVTLDFTDNVFLGKVVEFYNLGVKPKDPFTLPLDSKALLKIKGVIMDPKNIKRRNACAYYIHMLAILETDPPPGKITEILCNHFGTNDIYSLKISLATKLGNSDTLKDAYCLVELYRLLAPYSHMFTDILLPLNNRVNVNVSLSPKEYKDPTLPPLYGTDIDVVRDGNMIMGGYLVRRQASADKSIPSFLLICETLKQLDKDAKGNYKINFVENSSRGLTLGLHQTIRKVKKAGVETNVITYGEAVKSFLPNQFARMVYSIWHQETLRMMDMRVISNYTSGDEYIIKTYLSPANIGIGTEVGMQLYKLQMNYINTYLSPLSTELQRKLREYTENQSLLQVNFNKNPALEDDPDIKLPPVQLLLKTLRGLCTSINDSKRVYAYQAGLLIKEDRFKMFLDAMDIQQMIHGRSKYDVDAMIAQARTKYKEMGDGLKIEVAEGITIDCKKTYSDMTGHLTRLADFLEHIKLCKAEVYEPHLDSTGEYCRELMNNFFGSTPFQCA